MVRGWLERGVDGFRLDVFNAFFKDAELLSNPRRYRGRRPYDRQRHLYDKDRPELADFLAEFRALVDSLPGADDGRRAVLGRSGAGARAQRAAPPRLRLRADPPALERRGFADASQKHEERFGADGWPTIVLSNHDQSRQASRLAPGRRRRDERRDRPRAAAVLSLTLRGTPFLYYGEEIGARDVPVPWSEIIDPPAKRGGRLVRRLVPWWNRDQARSPMPWGDGPERRVLDGPAVAADGARRRRPATSPSRRPIRRRSWRPTAGSSGCAGGIPALQVGTLPAAARRRRATCSPTSARRPTRRSSWRSTSATAATPSGVRTRRRWTVALRHARPRRRRARRRRPADARAARGDHPPRRADVRTSASVPARIERPLLR